MHDQWMWAFIGTRAGVVRVGNERIFSSLNYRRLPPLDMPKVESPLEREEAFRNSRVHVVEQAEGFAMAIAKAKLVWILMAVLGGVLVDGKAEKEVTEFGIGVKFKPERCELKAHKGDLVSVHYRGTLADGTEFDNSYDRGQPLDFKLGQGSVIKGWDQGILGMCVGEKRKLKIPAKLAYGDRSVALSIPAGASLIFEAELVAVNGRTGPGPDDVIDELFGDLPPEDLDFGDPVVPF